MTATTSTKSKIKYRWIRLIMYLLLVILLAIVLVVPGVLRLIYRADSQVALGNAKSVRMAIQVAATERYGQNRIFSDASSQGGVAEDIYEEVLKLSKAPGDFWVLRMSEDGYTLEQFVYQEGEFTVWYESDPSSYRVYHEEQMTGAAAASEE